jgi:hypothetical protein
MGFIVGLILGTLVTLFYEKTGVTDAARETVGLTTQVDTLPCISEQ